MTRHTRRPTWLVSCWLMGFCVTTRAMADPDDIRSCAPQPPIEARLSVAGALARLSNATLEFRVTPGRTLQHAELAWDVPAAVAVAGGDVRLADLRVHPNVESTFTLVVSFPETGEFEIAAQIVDRTDDVVVGRRAKLYFDVSADKIEVRDAPRWLRPASPGRPRRLLEGEPVTEPRRGARFAESAVPTHSRPHSDDPSGGQRGNREARIVGRFYYMHHDGTGHGAWNSVAQIWDRDDWSSDDLLAEVIIAPNGYFDSGWFSNDNDVDVNDALEQDIYIRWRSQNGRVTVRDYFGSGVFTVQLDWDDNIPDGTHDVGGWIIDAAGPGNYPDDGIEGAFETCETLSVGWLHYASLGRDLDPVTCDRAPGSTEGAYYQGGARLIRLPDGDHFDPSVVLHEYGHHVMQVVKGGFPPGSGGPHGWFDCINEGLAWSEGWASYSGQSTLDDPVYAATPGFGDGGGWLIVNCESTSGDCLLPGTGGTDGEASVVSFLWDVFDQGPDVWHACDRLELGPDDIWDTFENGGMMDNMIDFGLAWIDRGHGHDAAFHALLADHNIWPRNDADDDCVPDDWDNCPSTPACAEVDTNGCPLDGDGDGVADGCDHCPNTPACAEVDSFGCPLDDDQDGVPNGCDACPDTPACAEVDSVGCPLDDDQDGVPNGCDACPGFDDLADRDGDGIADGCDNCPDIPNEEQFDYNDDGVGDACDCNDNGVPDDQDLEPSIGFDPLVDYASGNVQKGIAAADIDDDGDTDLLIASHGDDSLAVLVNTGDGSFVSAGPFSTGAGTGPWDVAVGDFNDDGLPDAAVANILPTTVSVLYSTGFGFSSPTSVDLGTAQEGIAAADLNGDGLADLVTANQDGSVALLENDGDGGFVISFVTIGNDILSDVAVSDLNGDETLDLVATLPFSNEIAIALNLDGEFQVSLYPVGANPAAATVSDLNGDGVPDVAVANSAAFSGVPSVSILLNDGTGVMTAAGSLVTADQPQGIAAADFDGDGDNDLAVTDNANGTVTVLSNRGVAEFVPTVVLTTDPQAYALVVAELNDDPWPDLAVTNFDSTTVAFGSPQPPVSVDCNANGVPDLCDIADGVSHDRNGNGVPDECERAVSPPDGPVAPQAVLELP